MLHTDAVGQFDSERTKRVEERAFDPLFVPLGPNLSWQNASEASGRRLREKRPSAVLVWGVEHAQPDAAIRERAASDAVEFVVEHSLRSPDEICRPFKVEVVGAMAGREGESEVVVTNIKRIATEFPGNGLPVDISNSGEDPSNHFALAVRHIANVCSLNHCGEWARAHFVKPSRRLVAAVPPFECGPFSIDAVWRVWIGAQAGSPSIGLPCPRATIGQTSTTSVPEQTT